MIAISPQEPADPAERLRIAGLTGVDAGLEIAGPGSRSYAFLIDWQIRVLAALAWVFVGLLNPGGLLGPRSGGHSLFMYAVVAPAVCIYVFYHPVLEVLMRGRTPGLRRAGLRLVTRSGGTPGTGALLIRNVFRLIDSAPAFYMIGLLCCFLTEQRVRIGDLAAGTLLVVDHAAPGAALAELGGTLGRAGAGALAPEAAELVLELLERWSALQPERRCALARDLLARLDRPESAPRDTWSEAQLHTRLRELLPADEHA
ncbi:MAG TPA: RDD family protein [Steroidobacteraceae bacterium]|nr:RDD family protein [Steroidobacteraceae bacterium]